jgi:prolyl oligopeptidase
MRRILILALTAMTMIPAGCSKSDSPPALPYPAATIGNVVDDYAGTKVADPYRWMEALDSKEVADWIAASNAVTEPYLKGLPLRQAFNTRLTELWNYPRVGLPYVVDSGALFYSRNSGLQRQAPVYMRTAATAPPTLVIDPNVISADGSLSLGQWTPSPDGSLLAYGLAEGGADWRTVKVRTVATGQDLSDEVRWMRFSDIAWTKDSKGFFYSRYPEPPKNKVLEAALSNHSVYYHRIGTPQAKDVLVYERKDLPEWIINGVVSEDGRYLFVLMFQGAENKNRLYYADLARPMAPNVGAPIRPLEESGDAEYLPFATSGSTVFVRSDKQAPNRAVLAATLGAPGAVAWKTVVPERKEAIESVAFAGGRIVAQYLVDVQSRLSLFGPDGTPLGDIPLPGTGSVGGVGGRADTPTVWYAFTSPLVPTTIQAYDQAAKTSSAFEAAKPPIDASQYETQALFATSKDGTKVPLFVTAKKGLARDGRNPTMLYAYGGFSVSILPAYRPDVPAWLERGGVWVTASLRGGAEYGESWHQAGMLERKQNVFDDFIAAAEFLVKEKYASPATLAMSGDSNGGLLVGAVMEQRPDLFAVALPGVGVMDMLRFDQFTGGRYWTTEYGSASNPAQFPFLIKYSPVHNVKKGTCYPATLITTADHDDRVVPSHSFKFAAALQAAQGCAKPVLIRVEVQGSHGYRPTDKLIAERADQWAFAAENMGVR